MIVEVVDKNSGAILFKKDKDSITIENLVKEVQSLSKKVNKLESEIKKLKQPTEENSL